MGERDWRDRGSGGERKGGVDRVLSFLRNALDERKLRVSEGRRNAGLIDEDNTESGTDDSLRCNEIGETCTRGKIGVVKLASAAGVAVNAKIVELLRREVEYRTLIVLLGGREMEGPSGRRC